MKVVMDFENTELIPVAKVAALKRLINGLTN